MNVAELLKSRGITDEVIAGLPKEVAATLEAYRTEADTALSTASTKAQEAEEARRQAQLEREEIDNYVKTYGMSLTEKADLEAKLNATNSYLKSLKDQGFDVEVP